jgi:hypothetical protein
MWELECEQQQIFGCASQEISVQSGAFVSSRNHALMRGGLIWAMTNAADWWKWFAAPPFDQSSCIAISVPGRGPSMPMGRSCAPEATVNSQNAFNSWFLKYCRGQETKSDEDHLT